MRKGLALQMKFGLALGRCDSGVMAAQPWVPLEQGENTHSTNVGAEKNALSGLDSFLGLHPAVHGASKGGIQAQTLISLHFINTIKPHSGLGWKEP